MRSWRVQDAAAAVVALVLAAVLVWQVMDLLDGRRLDARRSEVVKIADAQVIDLTTLDSTTVKDKLEAMARRTTGDFSQQLDGITATFVKVVNDQNLSATGTVNSTAIASLTERKAKVIVASSASVTQADGKTAVRNYRIGVDLMRVKGIWKVDGMEFVQ